MIASATITTEEIIVFGVCENEMDVGDAHSIEDITERELSPKSRNWECSPRRQNCHTWQKGHEHGRRQHIIGIP
jgi:hypothetical protein